jgi:hypothetical protein
MLPMALATKPRHSMTTNEFMVSATSDHKSRALPYTSVDRTTRLWEGATLVIAHRRVVPLTFHRVCRYTFFIGKRFHMEMKTQAN